jgi:hypothetical protein
MALVVKLLKEGFYSQELIDLMAMVQKREVLAGDLLRALKEAEAEGTFFELLLNAIDNENLLIHKN